MDNDVPVCVLSARSSVDDRVAGLEAGADDYLVKPFVLAELVARVKALREAGQRYPILILTARGSWQDKVEGLKYGADDYLVKPFHVEELLARINALVRRASGWSKPILACGMIKLDTTAQTVTVEGKLVDLTSYEYKVLEYLMLHAGDLVSKADLTEHIYQQDFDRDSNVLEVFIGRLRRKLDPEGTLKPIETVRGRGYRFAIPRTDGDDE
jgi:two-component system response regulator PhoP